MRLISRFGKPSWWATVTAFVFPVLLGAQSSSLSLGSSTISRGGTAPLTMSLNSPAGSEPAALQWSFAYSASDVASITVTSAGSSTGSSKTFSCTSSPGLYTCLASGLNRNLIPNGPVAVANIQVSPTANSAQIRVVSAAGASDAGNAVTVAGATGTITVQDTTPLKPATLACTPTAIASMGSGSCTATLNTSTTSTTSVSLTSNSSSLTVPTSVTVTPGNQSATFPVSAKSVTADETVTLTASLNGTSASTSVQVRAAATAGPIRVNTGGAAFVDSLGQTWSADTGYSSGMIYAVDHAISGTNAPALYQNIRWDYGFTYQFPVSNGTYRVNLKFAEIFFSRAGQRRFSVIINGQTVMQDFDIAAAAGGPWIAVDRSFTTNATAGQIMLQFMLGSADCPMVSGIEILPSTASDLPSSGEQYLSNLTWTSMVNGWGPVEKDRTNGDSGSGDGRLMSIRGVTYAKGLGAHAPSNIQYNLGAAGSCTSFSSDVGVDDETGGMGSVVFQVWADGAKLFDSGVMTANMAARNITVSVTGKSLLTLIVNDAGDGISNDHADWANARLVCNSTPPPSSPPLSGTKYLSDLSWTAMTNGWGPVEKDRSNGEQGSGDGQPLSIRGVTYAKGLGTHAFSNIQYNLAAAGSCTSFMTDVGVDDEAWGVGSVVFQVWVDGVKQFDSGVVTGSTPVKSATVPINGRSLLTLIVNDAGDGIGSDHADWANARLTCQ